MVNHAGSGRTVNIDKDLIAILFCHETNQAVHPADEAVIGKLNEAVKQGKLKNKAQMGVTESLDGGLIRADRKIVYPIREDIPVMLIEEGIPLEQIASQ